MVMGVKNDFSSDGNDNRGDDYDDVNKEYINGVRKYSEDGITDDDHDG